MFNASIQEHSLSLPSMEGSSVGEQGCHWRPEVRGSVWSCMQEAKASFDLGGLFQDGPTCSAMRWQPVCILLTEPVPNFIGILWSCLVFLLSPCTNLFVVTADTSVMMEIQWAPKPNRKQALKSLFPCTEFFYQAITFNAETNDTSP